MRPAVIFAGGTLQPNGSHVTDRSWRLIGLIQPYNMGVLPVPLQLAWLALLKMIP